MQQYPTLRSDRLRTRLALIEADPSCWSQSHWHCGAAHCIAGWGQIDSGCPANPDTVVRDARRWYGLTRYEAELLFAANNSLAKLRELVEEVCNRDADGRDRHGRDRDGYGLGWDLGSYDRDRDDYDRDGYDQAGYDIDGYNRAGYNRAGYNRDGYDRDGYNRAGYNRAGYNRDGYDRDGRDHDGYDRDGLDRLNRMKGEV